MSIHISNKKGFTILEVIIVVAVIGILFGISSRIIISATQNFTYNSKQQHLDMTIHTKMQRLSNFLRTHMAVITNILNQQPKNSVFAVANTFNNKPAVTQIYLSQLRKMYQESNNLIISQYEIVNNGTDLTYSNTADFLNITNNLIETKKVIATDVNDFNISYLDVNGNTTDSTTDLAFILLEITFLIKDNLVSRKLIISPWLKII